MRYIKEENIRFVVKSAMLQMIKHAAAKQFSARTKYAAGDIIYSILGGLGGALAGGGLGLGLPYLFTSDKNARKWRILTGVLGAALGGLGGASLLYALQQRSPTANEKRVKADQAAPAAQGLAPPLSTAAPPPSPPKPAQPAPTTRPPLSTVSTSSSAEHNVTKDNNQEVATPNQAEAERTVSSKAQVTPPDPKPYPSEWDALVKQEESDARLRSKLLSPLHKYEDEAKRIGYMNGALLGRGVADENLQNMIRIHEVLVSKINELNQRDAQRPPQEVGRLTPQEREELDNLLRTYSYYSKKVFDDYGLSCSVGSTCGISRASVAGRDDPFKNQNFINAVNLLNALPSTREELQNYNLHQLGLQLADATSSFSSYHAISNQPLPQQARTLQILVSNRDKIRGILDKAQNKRTNLSEEDWQELERSIREFKNAGQDLITVFNILKGIK